MSKENSKHKSFRGNGGHITPYTQYLHWKKEYAQFATEMYHAACDLRFKHMSLKGNPFIYMCADKIKAMFEEGEL